MQVNDQYIYLDHAAATPLDASALAAMEPYFSHDFFNPSSPYRPAIAVRRAYEDAKDRIAKVIGAKSNEMVMTAGATESINLAFSAVRGHVVTTTIEHHAVLAAARTKQATLIGVTEQGRIDMQALKDAITPETELVSVALANNEIGTLQPLREVVAVAQQERMRRRSAGETAPLYVHTDASQGLGLLDIHVARLGVDMITLNAGKVYGPKQVGLLWAASHVALQPIVVGGGQERGLRSGTENVAGVIGFAAALETADSHKKHESDRLRALRDTMQKALTERFANAVVSGHPKHQLPNFLHISFPGIDAERVLFAGSACAANKGTRSHVLTAIGLAPEVADGSIRMTLGKLSTEANCQEAVEHIIAVIEAESTRTGVAV
jgi:cysteine desulfurase